MLLLLLYRPRTSFSPSLSSFYTTKLRPCWTCQSSRWSPAGRDWLLSFSPSIFSFFFTSKLNLRLTCPSWRSSLAGYDRLTNQGHWKHIHFLRGLVSLAYCSLRIAIAVCDVRLAGAERYLYVVNERETFNASHRQYKREYRNFIGYLISSRRWDPKNPRNTNGSFGLINWASWIPLRNTETRPSIWTSPENDGNFQITILQKQQM